jgi:glycine cleavage system H lipoate-binding protein
MPGDIYATKGIEYLVVIAYLLVMAAAVSGFGRLRGAGVRAARPRGKAVRVQPWFSLADGYRFHQGHSWVAAKDGDVVTVGVDDFAAKALGAPDALELPAAGSALSQGSPAWRVRVGERVLPMLSPVEGEVVAVNPAVVESPRLLADEPYGAGWLLKVRVDHRPWPRNLFSGSLAAAWMQYTVERLRQLQAGSLGVVMPDGGTPVRGFARALSEEEWDALAREFFLAE